MKNNFYSNVFGWLFVGLLMTFGSAALISTNETLLYYIFNTSAYYGIFIAQIIICIVLSARIQKLKPTTAKILYLLYSLLTGCTFAILFLAFSLLSIIIIFLITSLTFGIFALIGKKTSVDLSKWGTYLLMALLAVIILEVINMFMLNNTLDMFACIVGIVIFFGYVAYDMQKIKRINDANEGTENLAIIGAFELYLDFINLFVRLLQLFGKSRD